MIFSSRGVTNTHNNLIRDVQNLVANTKRESRIQDKGKKAVIDDICFERSCNNFLYFESHKHTDLFLWVAKSPAGPSMKFQVKDIHTTEELKLQGNCLKYSRPFLSFDAGFESQPHLKLAKEMLV
jgi:ribosome biogenesis protein BRX1